MKKIIDISQWVGSLDQRIESVFPYGCLSCFGISKTDIDKVVLIPSMKILEPKRNILKIEFSQPEPGQHKQQILDLFGQMFLIHRVQPQVKMLLSLNLDFMRQERRWDNNPLRELQLLPEGSVKISAGCALFLHQVGVDIPAHEEGVIFSKEELPHLLSRFLEMAPRFQKAGGQ